MNTGPGEADNIVASIMRGKALIDFVTAQREGIPFSTADVITDLVNAHLAVVAVRDPDSLKSSREDLVGLMQTLTSVKDAEDYRKDGDYDF